MLLCSVRFNISFVQNSLSPKPHVCLLLKPNLCIQIKSKGPKDNYVDNLNSIQQQKPYTDGLIC